MSPNDWSWKRAAGLAVATLLAISILLIVTAPAVLVSVLKVSTWKGMADIGTAYQSVAAVVSALALAGIAASLFLQWRQLRVSQMFALRERTFELLKLEIENPDIFPLANSGGWRQQTYASLFVGHLASWWDMRAITVDGLRRNAAPLFRVPENREWWRKYGGQWSARPTAHRRRFHQILDDVVCQAAEEGDSSDSATIVDAPDRQGTLEVD